MLLLTHAESHLTAMVDRAATWFHDERDRLSARSTWRRAEQVLSQHGPALVVLLAALLGGILQQLSPSADAEAFLGAAHRLLSPDWANAFSDPFIQISPLHLGLVSAGVVISSLSGLPEYLVSGAVQAGLVAGLAVLAARSTLPPSPSTLRRAVLILIVVLGGPLASAALIGHDEELIVALLLITASGQRRTGWAPVLVGLAAGVKLWGLLGVPLLFVGVSALRGARRSSLAAGVVVLSYLPFALWGHIGSFDFVWRVAEGAPMSALVPVGDGFDWPWRLAQGTCAVAVGLLLARRGGSALDVLVAICCVRLLLDPNPFSYYGIALVLSLQHRALAVGRSKLAQVVATSAVPIGVLLPDVLRHAPLLYGVVEVFVLLMVLLVTCRLTAEPAVLRRLSSAAPSDALAPAA